MGEGSIQEDVVVYDHTSLAVSQDSLNDPSSLERPLHEFHIDPSSLEPSERLVEILDEEEVVGMLFPEENVEPILVPPRFVERLPSYELVSDLFFF